MTALPTAIATTPVTDPVGELAEWYKLRARIDAECTPLINQERALRKRLFDHFFPSPTEGTNNYVLPDGYIVKGKYPIDRKVDPGSLDGLRTLRVMDVSAEFLASLHVDTAGVDPETLVTKVMHLNLDALLRYTPDLEVKAYRTLTAEQQAIFDRCMTIKPGSIAMEVVPPTAKKPKALPAGFDQ